MFYRVRDDQTGCEPRKLFNLVDFLMLDKNHSGAVDQDECMTVLWARYGKELVTEHNDAMAKENVTFTGDAANEKNVNCAPPTPHSNTGRQCGSRSAPSAAPK